MKRPLIPIVIIFMGLLPWNFAFGCQILSNAEAADVVSKNRLVGVSFAGLTSVLDPNTGTPTDKKIYASVKILVPGKDGVQFQVKRGQLVGSSAATICKISEFYYEAETTSKEYGTNKFFITVREKGGGGQISGPGIINALVSK